MIEKYFSGYRENEVELSVEIKRCLLDFILKKSENIYYLIEFHEFEMTPKRVFEFTNFEKYCEFVENRDTFSPRLLIEKKEEFFSELNGKEIHAEFHLKGDDIAIEIWHVMKLSKVS
ncbi:MAG: hypothetical protein JSU04_07485 [Bdellovibrionales bacterium]|nr:hypothetical protein [Bdellovibrionales bacterium]